MNKRKTILLVPFIMIGVSALIWAMDVLFTAVKTDDPMKAGVVSVGMFTLGMFGGVIIGRTSK